MLDKRNPQCTFNIINVAISEERTEDGLKRVERDVICLCPDLVIIGYCLNGSILINNGLNI